MCVCTCASHDNKHKLTTDPLSLTGVNPAVGSRTGGYQVTGVCVCVCVCEYVCAWCVRDVCVGGGWWVFG